jgi:hypothetical protein
MEDFFDDLDWEDMAMIGGMAEEFTEEERDRRRWDRKEYRDPEDEFDFDNGFRRRPARSHFTRRRPKRMPFEQYAYEVAVGLKHHHDPLYGPAQLRRGPNRAPKNYRDTTLYGVLARNAHLVNENFLKFVCMILYHHKDQDLDQIIFDSNGKPVVDNHEVFSTYDRGTRIITMNLRKYFGNAVRVAEHGFTGFSIHSLIWITMISGFLHELKHALDACDPGYMDYVPREEQERVADGWAGEAKTFYASQGYTEMPQLSEEPYFGPLVNKYLKLVTKNSPPDWALNQQEMIDAGIFYRNNEAGIEICSMKEYYELSLRGLDGDELGRRLNDCHKIESGLEEQIWKQEEMSEMALREAISTNRSVRIKYVNADGSQFSQLIYPKTIFYRNYYLWVDAIDENSGELTSFRVDLIQRVTFLS